LEGALGKFFEAGIIAGLLVFNAALGFFQESRAQATLSALKSRLATLRYDATPYGRSFRQRISCLAT
jgi:magnesium-transporting ATPase (P-type)